MFDVLVIVATKPEFTMLRAGGGGDMLLVWGGIFIEIVVVWLREARWHRRPIVFTTGLFQFRNTFLVLRHF